MAGITIVIRKADKVPGSMLMQLKSVLDTSLGEAKQRLTAGSKLIEEELFGNDHDEVAERLRQTVGLLKQYNIDFSIHETGEGRELDNPDLDFWTISEETMMNILARSE
jgi:hypothetical protein